MGMTEPYKINRNKFIDWIDEDQMTSSLDDLKYDLKHGGEFIITAQGLLDVCVEVPVYLIENYIGFSEYVMGSECILIYKEEKNDTRTI